MSTAAPAQSVAGTASAQLLKGPVMRSLYRGLLREARLMDSTPVSKVLFPVNKKIAKAVGMHNQLYVPDNGQSYRALVKKVFRSPPPTEGELGVTPTAAFEVLNRLKSHREVIEGAMPRITKDTIPLTKALEKAAPPTHTAAVFKAKPLEVTTSKTASEALDTLHAAIEAGEPAPGAAATTTTTAATTTSTSGMHDFANKTIFGKSLTKRDRMAPVQAGMCLIAHPLSSAHTDRRVLMVLEKNPQVTTGLVLDMSYSYPLSNGNPMFPEVFWGHEVMNGGYCHVDFTMPPTANVSVLHTIAPPTKADSPEHNHWLAWATTAKIDPDKPAEHHDLLCKPLIRGKTLPDGTQEPTLYYSKVEALPYLASLCPGLERTKLRVFWGSMRWSTSQLVNEIEEGHWIPINVSPMFFGAYSVLPPLQQAVGQPAVVPRFPTEAQLTEAKAQREQHLGADVSPPQTFPPDQPLCRREALWDQILYALGGEFRSLVGCNNPFSNANPNQAMAPNLSDDVVRLLGAISALRDDGDGDGDGDGDE